MGRFDGMSALVTGGTGGIGSAIVRAFLDDGANVVVFGSSRTRLDALRETCDSERLRTLELDLRGGATEVVDATRAAIAEFGRLDILVNCAGVAFQTPILEISEEQWDTTLAVNLKSAFFLSQAAARHMVDNGGGSIINVCSVDSYRGGEALYADYSASKAALAHLTQVLTLELGPRGIRCNAIAPGPVATPMMDFADDPTTYNTYVRHLAQRRFSSPEEQARVVLFLASDDASNIAGEVVRVDGGWALGMWPDPSLEPEY